MADGLEIETDGWTTAPRTGFGETSSMVVWAALIAACVMSYWRVGLRCKPDWPSGARSTARSYPDPTGAFVVRSRFA